MAVSITVRNVPDDVRDALAARAATSGRSLQEYLATELRQLAARPDIASAVAALRSRAHHYPPARMAEIVDDIVADRR